MTIKRKMIINSALSTALVTPTLMTSVNAYSTATDGTQGKVGGVNKYTETTKENTIIRKEVVNEDLNNKIKEAQQVGLEIGYTEDVIYKATSINDYNKKIKEFSQKNTEQLEELSQAVKEQKDSQAEYTKSKSMYENANNKYKVIDKNEYMAFLKDESEITQPGSLAYFDKYKIVINPDKINKDLKFVKGVLGVNKDSKFTRPFGGLEFKTLTEEEFIASGNKGDIENNDNHILFLNIDKPGAGFYIENFGETIDGKRVDARLTFTGTGVGGRNRVTPEGFPATSFHSWGDKGRTEERLPLGLHFKGVANQKVQIDFIDENEQPLKIAQAIYVSDIDWKQGYKITSEIELEDFYEDPSIYKDEDGINFTKDDSGLNSEADSPLSVAIKPVIGSSINYEFYNASDEWQEVKLLGKPTEYTISKEEFLKLSTYTGNTIFGVTKDFENKIGIHSDPEAVEITRYFVELEASSHKEVKNSFYPDINRQFVNKGQEVWFNLGVKMSPTDNQIKSLEITDFLPDGYELDIEKTKNDLDPIFEVKEYNKDKHTLTFKVKEKALENYNTTENKADLINKLSIGIKVYGVVTLDGAEYVNTFTTQINYKDQPDPANPGKTITPPPTKIPSNETIISTPGRNPNTPQTDGDTT